MFSCLLLFVERTAISRADRFSDDLNQIKTWQQPQSSCVLCHSFFLVAFAGYGSPNECMRTSCVSSLQATGLGKLKKLIGQLMSCGLSTVGPSPPCCGESTMRCDTDSVEL